MQAAISTISPIEPYLKEFYKHYHHKSCLKKIGDFVISILRDIIYILMIPYLRCTSNSLYGSYKNPIWKPNSKGLIVLVHGLKGDPSIWRTHVKELKSSPDFDLYIPTVYMTGNCKLSDATTPIQEKIIDYIQKHPLNKICLIGFSNGARIVTSIETNLRQLSPETLLKISTIAGVHLGSPIINRLSKTPLLKNLFHPELKADLSYGSQNSLQLLNRVVSPLPNGVAKRSYEFYASTNDLAVPNIDSSLPHLNLGERFHVVHGYGHKSIVGAVAKQQLTSCLNWLIAN